MKNMFNNVTVNGEFLASESVINTNTGEVLSLSNNDKYIYMYMYTTYLKFKRKNKDYFQSNESIGLYNNTSEASVKRTISKLIKLGLLKIRGCKTYRVLTVNNIMTKTYKLIHTKWDYYHTDDAQEKRREASENKAKIIAEKKLEHDRLEEERKKYEELSYLNRKANNRTILLKEAQIERCKNPKQVEFLKQEIKTIEMNIYSKVYSRTIEQSSDFEELDRGVGQSVVPQTTYEPIEMSQEDWMNMKNESVEMGFMYGECGYE